MTAESVKVYVTQQWRNYCERSIQEEGGKKGGHKNIYGKIIFLLIY